VSAPALALALHRFWLAASLCLAGALAVPAWAQDAGAQRESAVKAAYLYRFAGFVEWPAGTLRRPDEPLVIGVLADEAVAADLEQVVAGRTIDGRPVTARRLREGEPVAGVHVLLLGTLREARLREVLATVPGPVLVVTEQEGGLRAGGVLNFSSDGGRVRFSASLASAAERNLKLSARLLAVAQSVEGRTP
jgi:hypothetical protein